MAASGAIIHGNQVPVLHANQRLIGTKSLGVANGAGKSQSLLTPGIIELGLVPAAGRCSHAPRGDCGCWSVPAAAAAGHNNATRHLHTLAGHSGEACA